jgi:hypothetical protein
MLHELRRTTTRRSEGASRTRSAYQPRERHPESVSIYAVSDHQNTCDQAHGYSARTPLVPRASYVHNRRVANSCEHGSQTVDAIASRGIARTGYLTGQERRDSQNSSRSTQGRIRASAPYVIDGAEACRRVRFGLCPVACRLPLTRNRGGLPNFSPTGITSIGDRPRGAIKWNAPHRPSR